MFRREAVDLFVSFFGVFLERFLQRSIRELDSADVGDVLALSERPIYVQAWQRFVFIVLINNRLRALLEFFAGLRRPPIGQISDFVVLPALIVEAVCHLVTDYCSDPAVIHCVIRVGVEEWRLQNAGRENNLVHLRIVVRVHRRRRHSPFRAIDRFADLVQLALRFKIFCAQFIQHKRPAIDLER